MNKFILISIPVVIGIIILSSLLISNNESVEPESNLIYDAGFTYYDIEKIRNILAEQNIFVSSPTAITDQTIDQYCTYFQKGLPRSVEYCTTTAVVNADGDTIGNINIGGNTQSPILAIANLETSSLESNQEETIAVFKTMIETLVCDCWDEKKSADYESVTDWMEGVRTFYYDSDQRSITSKIDNLADHEIFLEITTMDNSVLQTLIILK
ncbi:hypothetical protein C5F47_03230 [Nitrosopumilus cobalaminigenes]|uniref:Uncharacterized protein n=1 Tax=Nitrosopumilus cobalaminigenes TaxID=1470066 RepID=A0A7D5QYQ3_9ARCH|nr:hypothetical protein [Nitrosopumilus cobalaminigenes]QLH02640.1 hypothetical protein C5F47_03230 [Nitrosopumilus cobalaminigenes]